MKQRISKIFSNNWMVMALFAITSLVVYSNSFDVPFLFDDQHQVLFNNKNTDLSTFSDLNTWANVNYRPVSTFTLALNYAIGGEQVFGYHLFNYLVHLFSAVFFFFFLKQLFKFRQKQPSVLLPVAATLFFLLHPVQTQSVTYIVQRMTSLSGMFTMLAVFAYTAGRYRFVIEKKRVSSFLFLTLAAVASVFALLSKQTAATIPVLFVLIELFFVRDINGNRRKPWALFIALATIVLYTVVISVFGLPAETTEISRLDYLATQMTVIPHYLQRMLIPIGLCIDHGVQPLNNLFDFRAVAGTLFLFALFLFAFYKSRKWPFFSFGIFWIFTTLLVESSVIPIRDVMFDHRMYLPLAGFSLSLWWLIFYLLEGKPKVAGALVIIVALIMGAATFARNNVWSDRTAIWEEVTQKYPDHFRGWMSVGRSLAASGSSDIPKIIDSYEKALEIDPEYYQLWNDLATNYIKVGNTEKASECYQELKKSENPEHQAIAHRGLGIFSLRDNNYPTAEKHLLKTLELNPADSTALHGLSTLYFRTQQWNKVLEYSEKYLDNFSNKPDLLFNAGFAAYKTDDFEKAEVYFKQVLEKQPENVNALVYRGNALVKMQRYKKAVTFFMKAYQLTNKQEFFEVAKRLKNMGFE